MELGVVVAADEVQFVPGGDEAREGVENPLVPGRDPRQLPGALLLLGRQADGPLLVADREGRGDRQPRRERDGDEVEDVADQQEPPRPPAFAVDGVVVEEAHQRAAELAAAPVLAVRRPGLEVAAQVEVADREQVVGPIRLHAVTSAHPFSQGGASLPRRSGDDRRRRGDDWCRRALPSTIDGRRPCAASSRRRRARR